MYSLKWVRSALDNKYQNKENKSIFTDTVSWRFVGVHFYSTVDALNIFLYRKLHFRTENTQDLLLLSKAVKICS